MSGLLTMVGIEADPLAGREHILLANLIDHAWASGHDLDLATLVIQVQDPPLRKLGVYELEAFYPAKERAKLAMTLNGLLASRSFSAWGEGPDLDIDRLLRSADGARPACAIVSLAHLSDEERQFVVSLLLGRLITWMRRQPGTDTLRLLVYFDEVMGFVPPTAAPPAKKPILTLFKQARAFGVGMVLATQNPVDVDYKGLANAGTWMIGRLQTEQDKSRLLDGLSSAGGAVDVGAVGDAIGGLGKREFMLRSPGADAPSLFTSRWAMSYLRGPLTREQIATLMAGRWPPPSAPGARNGSGGVGARRRAGPGCGARDRGVLGNGRRRPPATAAAPATAADRGCGAVGDGVLGPFAHACGRRRRAGPAAGGRGDTGALARPGRAVGGPGGSGRRRDAVRAGAGAPGVAALRRRQARAAGDRGVGGGAVPARRHGRPGRGPGRRPRRARPAERAAGRRHVRAGRRAARPGPLVRGRREGRGRPPVPQPHTPGAAQPGPRPRGPRRARDPTSSPPGAAPPRPSGPTPHRSRSRPATRLGWPRPATSLEAARDKIAQAEAAQTTRRSGDLVTGAGSLLGAVLGGRRDARRIAREVGRVVAGKGRSDEAAQRVRSARNREEDRVEALERLEADLARELTAIDDEWDGRAAEVQAVDVPLETLRSPGDGPIARVGAGSGRGLT